MIRWVWATFPIRAGYSFNDFGPNFNDDVNHAEKLTQNQKLLDGQTQMQIFQIYDFRFGR